MTGSLWRFVASGEIKGSLFSAGEKCGGWRALMCEINKRILYKAKKLIGERMRGERVRSGKGSNER